MGKNRKTWLILILTCFLFCAQFFQGQADSSNLNESSPFSPVIYEQFITHPLDSIIISLDVENDFDIDYIAGSGCELYLWENEGIFKPYELLYRLEDEGSSSDAIQYGGLASGDINNDGYTDIIVGGSFAKLRILENEGGTGFSEIFLWDFEQDLFAVDVVDWNNDGFNDIVVGYTYETPLDSRVALLLNIGDEGFSEPVELYRAEAREFSDLDADDFDNDGDCDILISYSTVNNTGLYYVNGTIVFLQNNGLHSFIPSIVTHRGDGEYHGKNTRIHPRLAVADYDQDGDFDFAFGDNSGIVELLWNDGNGSFQEPLILNDFGNISKITDADYDMDGDIDLVVSTRGYDYMVDGGFYVIYNNIVRLSLQTPQSNHLYLFDHQLHFGDSSMLIGPTTFRINRQVETDYVEFYVNDKLMNTDNTYPFEWRWSKLHFGEASVKIIGYFSDGTTHALQEHYTKFF